MMMMVMTVMADNVGQSYPGFIKVSEHVLVTSTCVYQNYLRLLETIYIFTMPLNYNYTYNLGLFQISHHVAKLAYDFNYWKSCSTARNNTFPDFTDV